MESFTHLGNFFKSHSRRKQYKNTQIKNFLSSTSDDGFTTRNKFIMI